MTALRILRTTRSGLVVLTILFISALPAAHAAPQFEVHGRQVTVTTERYRVVVDGLAVVQIENRLTGEVYARSDAEPPSASMRQMLGNQGVLVETLRPKVPDRRYGLGGKTRVSSKIEDHRVVMRYVGLQHGSGEHALFEENMTDKKMLFRRRTEAKAALHNNSLKLGLTRRSRPWHPAQDAGCTSC